MNMNTLELQQLQQKFNALPKQLVSAAGNMDIVLSMAAEAHTVPLNEIIPMGSTDQNAFACLRQIRHDFISRVIVFRNVLLPVSKDVVNGLLTFLDYMEDEEVFLQLAREGEVSILCAKYADEASTVQEGYETLASDLLRMGTEMDVKLKKVSLDVQNLLRQQEKNRKMASSLKTLSTGLVATGLVGGAVLALCLLGPGGVLFAPAVAPAAFSACCAGGGAAGLSASYFASQKTDQGVALQASAGALHDAHQAAQQQLPNAVKKFADAMEHLATFFNMLSDSVQRIENTAGRVEARLREDMLTGSYKALYKLLCSQMGKVKQSCTDYNAFVSYVNIRVNNLQLEEQKPVLSYIEDWFNEQQAQVEDKGERVGARLLKLKNRGLKCITGGEAR